VRHLTLTDLRQLAQEKARGGFVARAVGVTYAQAAERALEQASLDDLEQFARWWVREKLEAGTLVSSSWAGEPEDLPLALGPENARRIVERTAELWQEVVFDAFREGVRARSRA
jgi:hypothetical protein